MQYLNCWLSRQSFISSNTAHSLAAFVSGLPFCIYPNSQLLAHALAITIKLGWSIYLNRTTNEDRPEALNFLARLPIGRLFYPLAFAYLLQMRVFYPWLAPAVLKNLMNLTTNYKYIKHDCSLLFVLTLVSFLETIKSCRNTMNGCWAEHKVNRRHCTCSDWSERLNSICYCVLGYENKIKIFIL